MRHLRKCVLLVLAMAIFMAPSLQTANAAANPIRVLVDDKEVVFDASPFIENGRVLVPIRGIAEALNFDVEWLPQLKSIILTSKPGSIERTITIYVGEEYAFVDYNNVSLDVPAKIVSGRTYLPLRFVSESTGAEVEWEPATRTVQITSPVPLLRGKSADTSFSVLHDRLSIKMPEGSVDQDIYNGGIMGTMSDSSRVTRIILSEKEEAFIAYAEELFMYSTGDILKDVELFIELNTDSVENYVLSAPVRVSAIQYVTFSPNEIEVWDSAFLKGSVIKMPDNTLVFLGIYASAHAMAARGDCLRLADEVIGSVKAGSKRLDTAQRVVDMYDYSIKLERDYVYATDYGVDFTVDYFYKLVPIGDFQPIFGIYAGAHPSLFGSSLPYHEQESGTVFGRQRTWEIYCSQKGVMDEDTFAETLIEADWWYWHIFVKPGSRGEWQTIGKMLASMKEI